MDNSFSRSRRHSAHPALSDQVKRTLSQTFTCVGVMLAITAGVSYATMGMSIGLGGQILLLVGAIVTIIGILFNRNNSFGVVLLGVLSAILGASFGPALAMHLAMPNGGQNVGLAAGLTAAATFACASYSLTTRKDFSRWRGFLFGALIVLVLAGIAGIFLPIPGLHLALSAAGSLLFLAYLLMDVSDVVNGNETNYIVASVNIYLDIFNLFVNLLRLIGILGSDD